MANWRNKVIDVHRSMEIPTSTAVTLDHIAGETTTYLPRKSKIFQLFSTCFSSQLSTPFTPTPPPPPPPLNRIQSFCLCLALSWKPSLSEHVLNRSISCTRVTVVRRARCRLVWPLANIVIVRGRAVRRHHRHHHHHPDHLHRQEFSIIRLPSHVIAVVVVVVGVVCPVSLGQKKTRPQK